MNNITTEQNNPNLIELLKAQRMAYSQCKRFQFFDVISILIAILFPLIALMKPESQNAINAFGVLWTIAYLLTELYRKSKTTQGATIQEQFDTELFGLNWNKVLCKSKINIDTIQELSSKYKNNDLQNWYSIEIDNSLPKEIAIILCQRINFSWEINQRKKFVRFLAIITVLYYLIYIIIGFTKNIGFFDLLILLSPSIPFLVFSVQNILSLKSHITSKNETLSYIDSELDNYKTSRTITSLEQLRQIQDTIFTERTVTEKVPDWFYRLNKSTNEKFIDNLIIKIQNNF
ncbi:S-4TM family putative pore-forming effector [Polaribacter sp. 11A2H]|uniref:S-4TM family putative pore-forming effector n=1 Tax=Polaribacter sp. 11A2H TaxID=2687290 RepID=UPI00140C3D8B|nr:S-4TM family putative pore-forming effector [Polaribacter sp. 11A2H]